MKLPSLVGLVAIVSSAVLAAALAACSSDPSTSMVSPPSGPPGGDGGAPDAEGGVTSPVDPVFSAEGAPLCPTPHFCLEYPHATTASLDAIATTAAGGLYAVGNGGAILHSASKGASWVTVPSGTDVDLHAVLALATTVLIAGDHGTVLRLHGSAFEKVEVPTDANLTSIWGASADDVWAVGTATGDAGTIHGVVLHWNGTTWSHLGDDALPPITSVHGSSADDVWIAGGGIESLALYHLVSGAWKPVTAGIQDLEGVEGPARSLFVVSPNEVHVAATGVNFTSVTVYDGAAFHVEYSKLDAGRLGAIARGPDGALWVAADPPLHGAAGSFTPTTDVPSFTTQVTGLAWASGDLVVAGHAGLLGRAKDPALVGPSGGLVAAKGFADGNVVQGLGGLFTQSAAGVFRPFAAAVEYDATLWFGANGPNDVALWSLYEGTDVTDPNRSLDVFRWNGAASTRVLHVNGFTTTATPLALAPNGDLWWKERQTVGKLARGASAWTPFSCNGKPVAAAQIWANATDTLMRSDDGTTVKLVHLDAAGTCTVMPPLFYWANERAIGGTRYDDLWTVDSYDGLGHWDGTAWTKVATPPQPLCSMLFLGAKDMWLSPCMVTGKALTIFHWDGSTFTSLPVAPGTSSPMLWGSDAAHLWATDTGGLIYRYKP